MPARSLSTSLVLLCLCLTAAADIVHTRDGRKIKGDVTRRDGLIIVTTAFGTMELTEADVLRIEPSADPRLEFEERFAAVRDQQDAAALEELARWCGQQALSSERRQVLTLLKELDPDNEYANQGLGLVRFEERWISRSEADRLQQEQREREMKEKGLVLHEGRWIPLEEREAIENGLVRRGERWVTEAVARTLDGWIQYQGTWRMPVEIEAQYQRANLARIFGQAELQGGAHSCLVTDLPGAAAERLHAALEGAGVALAGLFGGEPPMPYKMNLPPGEWNRCLAIVCSSQEVYRNYLDQLVTRELIGEDGAETVRSGLYWDVYWPPLAYLYVSDLGEEYTRACLVDSHVELALHHRTGGRYPAWLYVGLSDMLQLDIVGTIGSLPAGSAIEHKELDVQNLGRVVRSGLKEGYLPVLDDLLVKPLDQFRIDDVAQSLVLLRTLMSQENPRLGAFLISLTAQRYDPQGLGINALRAQAAAFEQIYGLSLEELAGKWREYATASPSAGIRKDG